MCPLPLTVPLPEVVVEWPRSVVVMVPEPEAVPPAEQLLRTAAPKRRRRGFSFMLLSLCGFRGRERTLQNLNQSGKSRSFRFNFNAKGAGVRTAGASVQLEIRQIPA
jgi:hypothetical protein